MPTPTSLQKAVYLKKLLDDAFAHQTSIASLPTFNLEFDALIERFQDTPSDAFPKTLKLNRGDSKQARFYHLFTAPNKKSDFSIDQYHEALEDQVSRLCKNFIENLDSTGMPESLRQSLHQKGIYSILYHHSRTHTDPAFITAGKEILQDTQRKLAFSAVSIAIFATVSFIGPIFLLPLATALFASSMAYMSGLLYGVLNDILATRYNPAYFILGHQAGQRSFFASNDLLVQAIGWGVIASESIATIAAQVFGIATFISASLSTAPIAPFVLPLLALSVPFAVLAADCYARYKTQSYIKNGISLTWVNKNLHPIIRDAFGLAANAQTIPLDKIDFDSEEIRAFLIRSEWIDEYQLSGHALMSSSIKEKATWLANSDRNLAGYIGAPILAIGILIALLSISKTVVPAIFFTSLLSTTLPILTATILVGALAGAIRYALLNSNKQIDNKYKLNHENNSYQAVLPDKLYFNREHIEAASALTPLETRNTL